MSFTGRPAFETQSPNGGGLAVGSGFVFSLTDPSDSGGGLIWSDDNDITQHAGNEALEMWLDLSNVTQVRFVAKILAAAPAGAALGMHYSTDGVAFDDDLTSPALSIDGDATGWQDSGFQPIVAGARGSVYLRPWGSGMNGMDGAQANPCYLQFK